MVMGRRPGVARSSWPIAATDLVGLAGQLAAAHGPGPVPQAVVGGGQPSPQPGRGRHPRDASGRSWATRPRSPSTSAARSRWCSTTCAGWSSPPVVRSLDVVRAGRHGGRGPRHLVPARGGAAAAAPCSTCTAAATSARRPGCTRLFTAWLCRRTGCEIFVADLRLAPEFPFPAGLEDAVLVLEALLAGGRRSRPGCSWPATRAAGDWPRPSSTPCSRTAPPAHRRGGAVLAGAGPPARRAVGLRQRRQGHPALEHPDLRLPARTGPGVGGRCPRSTRTCPAGPRPSSPSGATRCSATPSGSFVDHLDGAGVDDGRHRGARDVPRVPHPHALGRGQPPDLPAVGQFVRAHLPEADPHPDDAGDLRDAVK